MKPVFEKISLVPSMERSQLQGPGATEVEASDRVVSGPRYGCLRVPGGACICLSGNHVFSRFLNHSEITR